VTDIDAAPLTTILNGLLLFLLAAAVVSLVVRFRRSRGVERQQLKWFTYAGVLVLLAPLSNSLLPSLYNAPYVLVVALPVSVGIAVLRYRLWTSMGRSCRRCCYGDRDEVSQGPESFGHDPVEDPYTSAFAGQQPRLIEHLEVVADGRLGQAKRLDQMTDARLAAAGLDQAEQP
jgi:hypothetical protein